MTTVLAMLELDGPTDALLGAADRLEGLLELVTGTRSRAHAGATLEVFGHLK